jgi:hypothetical protein
MTDQNSNRFRQAIERFDRANAKDPSGEALPYSQRMTKWLDKLEHNASEALKLAARAQHIRRWEIPRSSYPMDRTGYLQWRKTLYDFHAKKAGEILREVGYDAAAVGRVQSLLRKEKLKLDPEMQTLEDVICLVFLENYFSDFAREKDEQKLLGIIKRTWLKMSERGRQVAMTLRLSDHDLALIRKAISQ